MIYFPQDEDVFDERMRINNQDSSEIETEAVVLKDLTKVCCTVKLLQNVCIHQILYKQVSASLFPHKLQLDEKWRPKYLCLYSEIESSFHATWQNSLTTLVHCFDWQFAPGILQVIRMSFMKAIIIAKVPI